MSVGIRQGIEDLTARITAELLPGYVSELHALAALLAKGERGLNDRWHELRHGLGLEISTAMARLATFEKALAVVELAERREAVEAELHAASLEEFDRDFETFESGWGQRTPSGKQAAAKDY